LGGEPAAQPTPSRQARLRRWLPPGRTARLYAVRSAHRLNFTNSPFRTARESGKVA
jgi:hypothetical protein